MFRQEGRSQENSEKVTPMGLFNLVRTAVTSSRSISNPSAAHNVSVDEGRRREGACAQLHLPTGRMCTLPHGHTDSCTFVAPDQVAASLADRLDTDDGAVAGPTDPWPPSIR